MAIDVKLPYIHVYKVLFRYVSAVTTNGFVSFDAEIDVEPVITIYTMI